MFGAIPTTDIDAPVAVTVGVRSSWRHVSAELGAAIIPNTNNGTEVQPYFGLAGRL